MADRIKKEPLARLIVIRNGHEFWHKYPVRIDTLKTLEYDAEWWVYDRGAEYARIDIWYNELKDWGVYKEYEKRQNR